MRDVNRACLVCTHVEPPFIDGTQPGVLASVCDATSWLRAVATESRGQIVAFVEISRWEDVRMELREPGSSSAAALRVGTLLRSSPRGRWIRSRLGDTGKYWLFIAPSLLVILSIVLFPWVFTICYTAFGLLVAATLIFCPPRWRRRHALEPAAVAAAQ